MVNRKEPESELEPDPEPQFVIPAPAPGGNLIPVSRLSAPATQHYYFVLEI